MSARVTSCVAIVAIAAALVGHGVVALAQGPRVAADRTGLQRRIAPAFVGSAPGTAAAQASTATSAAGRPSLEPIRLGVEVLASAYAGIGGFLLGRYAGNSVATMTGATSEDTRERVAHATGVLAGGLTTAGSVYAIGSIGDQTGSFRDALIGAGAGYVTSLAIRWVAMGTSSGKGGGDASGMRWMSAAIESLLPAIGSTIAFNSSRRYK